MGREERPKAAVELRRRALGRKRATFGTAPPVPAPIRLRGGAVRGVWETESPFQGRGSNF
jgi:hypothetical protein